MVLHLSMMIASSLYVRLQIQNSTRWGGLSRVEFIAEQMVRFVEARLIAPPEPDLLLVLRCWRGGGSAVAVSGAG